MQLLQVTAQRSARSTYVRSVWLTDFNNKQLAKKVFIPPNGPFEVDKMQALMFRHEHYHPTYEARDKHGLTVGTKRLTVLSKNRRWGEGLGTGLGTFLMSTTWMCAVLLLVMLTAIPFWAMIMATRGFFGKYSAAIADVRRTGSGIPYMQPYALREGMRIALATVLPALNLASILEDKDERDLTSRMRFGNNMPFGPWNLGRDWFLLSAHLLLCPALPAARNHHSHVALVADARNKQRFAPVPPRRQPLQPPAPPPLKTKVCMDAVIALMDVLAVLIILGARARFQHRMKRYEGKYDAKVVELSDYTVLVSGLPKGLDEHIVEQQLRACAFVTLCIHEHALCCGCSLL